ncbi:hypothetical protein DL89DRAFT_265889 [Linderina pennispora]|uniref:C2H2-type domain-containing protein n=1 Tax=Linderina pennispora TaxID=61395 RepID=A0A1Y1WFK0_9FUNG|nr:uncharacterized protein DL89DRAFT_265889 [Linderina pennispora]ORX72293.1 hypothetical protein DL89DRAFT_265889 [Linderina pennispora]
MSAPSSIKETNAPADARYECQDCNRGFSSSSKLQSHCSKHMSVLRTRFGSVVLDFQVTSSNHVLCRCGDMYDAEAFMLNHKHRCLPCIEEAASMRLRSESAQRAVAEKKDLSVDVSVALPPSSPAPPAVQIRVLRPRSGAISRENPLKKIGLLVHESTGLLICLFCQRVLTAQDIRRHYESGRKYALGKPHPKPDREDINAAFHYLRANPIKVNTIAKAKKWVGSLRGKAIPRVAFLPVYAVNKCGVCGYISDDKGTMSSHINSNHRGYSQSQVWTTALAQKLFSQMIAKYIEVCDH